MFDKGMMSKIYEDFLQLSKKNKKVPNLKKDKAE